MRPNKIDRVILVPGLFESGLAMIPMRRVLRRHFDKVEIFSDRIAFRDLQHSVDRLRSEIDRQEPVVLVTHSFGDWVARQAILNTPNHNVVAMVSLAPAMKPGWLLKILRVITANQIPEIAALMDPAKACLGKSFPFPPNHLVLWAAFDDTVKPVDLPMQTGSEVRKVFGTHISLIFQPNIYLQIIDFLKFGQSM